MPRTPLSDAPSFSPKELDGFSITLQTITPMFGGSAIARKVDPEFPVRAASVRGHLRFWWRATAGAQYSDPKKLYETESAIWGNTDTPGRVRIEVIYSQDPKDRKSQNFKTIYPSQLGKGGGSPARTGLQEAYFTFPFQKNSDEDEALGLADVQFSLHISMQPQITKAQKNEIQQAIRAWIAFGGIGSRTRRGCGALTVITKQQEWLASNPEQLLEWFGSQKHQLTKAEFTLLQGAKAYFTTPTQNNDVVQGVWRNLGCFWTRFRKGHFTEYRPSYNPMNGGAWKDYDTLKDWQHNKTKSIQLCKPYFGLPIIYQQGEFTETLNAIDDHGTRLASPIILKPCAFLDGIRGMVLVLNTPQPDKIIINQQECVLEIPTFDPVLRELNVHGPLAAVGAAAKRCGYDKEVKL